MKKIELTQNRVALVDDKDFEYLSQYKWCFNSNGYAVTNESFMGKRKLFLMHRLILGALSEDKIQRVDHKDMNKLNNQKINLRFADKSQNAANRLINKNNISGYKGVSWNKRDKRWQAKIGINGKQLYLGEFKDPIKAAKNYDFTALKYFGKFARINFSS